MNGSFLQHDLWNVQILLSKMWIYEDSKPVFILCALEIIEVHLFSEAFVGCLLEDIW